MKKTNKKKDLVLILKPKTSVKKTKGGKYAKM